MKHWLSRKVLKGFSSTFPLYQWDLKWLSISRVAFIKSLSKSITKKHKEFTTSNINYQRLSRFTIYRLPINIKWVCLHKKVISPNEYSTIWSQFEHPAAFCRASIINSNHGYWLGVLMNIGRWTYLVAFSFLNRGVLTNWPLLKGLHISKTYKGLHACTFFI